MEPPTVPDIAPNASRGSEPKVWQRDFPGTNIEYQHRPGEADEGSNPPGELKWR